MKNKVTSTDLIIFPDHTHLPSLACVNVTPNTHVRVVKRFSENSETQFKKRDDFTGQTFENNMFVPSRPAKKRDGTGRPAILSRTVLNPGCVVQFC